MVCPAPKLDRLMGFNFLILIYALCIGSEELRTGEKKCWLKR
jgi:hypothetical protein